MGLPIAVGGKALSSRPVECPTPMPDDADDGTPLDPVALKCAPRVATAVSHDQRLSATCVISYYDLIRQDNRDREQTVAEIRIQISPLAQAYSSAFRDVLHRIPLPESSSHNEENNEEFVPLSPSVVLASDGRHIACTIPYPRCQKSILVIFQMRKPKTDPFPCPPRPSYLGPAPVTPVIRIATNPQVTKLPNGRPLLKASALCNADTDSGSILLAGCADGSILVIVYRPAQVAGILHQSRSEEAISFLSHQTTLRDDEDGSRGKLVAIEQSGAAVIFSSHLVVSHTSDLLLLQLERGLELDGSFVRAVWMGPSFLALLLRPGHASAAQVWAVDEHRAKPISTLIMTLERLKEYAHGSFSLESFIDEEPDGNCCEEESLGVATALHYDKSSSCLALSSVVLSSPPEISTSESHSHLSALPFACVWHWRTNVVGLTLAARSRHAMVQRGEYLLWPRPILSELTFSEDYSGGKVLAHVLMDGSRRWTSNNRIRKEMYTLALLSPSETWHGTGSGCEQPASLMLSAKCVTFPCVVSPFSDRETEFVWKDSRIPASYTAAFGSPRLACIGQKRCRSIAVAASRGLCVLDCSRMSSDYLLQSKQQPNGQKPNIKVDGTVRVDQPKWRLFGSETDERGFRVLAMTWWEGDVNFSYGSDDLRSDDLLLAVIELQNDSGDTSDDQRFLACWSRRRLDQNSQLILPVRSDPSVRQGAPFWGIPLPNGSGPTSISLLSNPSSLQCTATDSSTIAQSKRKAVLLVCFDGQSGDRNDDATYQLYQLEALQNRGDQETQELRFVVEANLRSNGSFLAPVSSPEATRSGVFLASASFDFHYDHDDPSSTLSSTFLATVGIIRSPGKGLEAMVIASSGVHSKREILRGSYAQTAPEVSSYWQSHTSCGSPSRSLKRNSSEYLDRFFVWSLELCDGSLLCWSVPYVAESYSSKPISIRSVGDTEHTSNCTNGFSHPSESLDESSENETHRWLLGSVTPIGDSCFWMQEPSSANRTGFSLGCLPTASFGCTIRCAQSGRYLHRVAPNDNVHVGSTMNLDHEVFCLGSTELAPPCFVPALFSSLLGGAERIGTNPLDRNASCAIDFSSTTANAFASMNSSANEHALVVALRLMIIRTVELISNESDRNDVSSRHSLFLATAMFTELIDIARQQLSPMHFASLFLGIGRQIEPSYLPHLFPLPYDGRTSSKQWHQCRSVEDLFLNSVRNGSISVPSSALPLFLSKSFSLKMCGSLLFHCLFTFGANADNPKSAVFDLSVEERRLLRGIFRFGVKMEDSGSMPHLDGLDDKDPLRILEVMNGGDSETHSSAFYSDTDDETRGLIVSSRRNSSRICQLFSPSAFFSKYSRPKEEEEIFEAASSFITSGFDDITNGFDIYQNGESVTDRRDFDRISDDHQSQTTMAGIVASFLLPLTLGSEKRLRWKQIFTLAQVLLGDNYTERDSSAFENIEELMKLADAFSLEIIIASLQAQVPFLRKPMSKTDNEEGLVRLIRSLLVECGSIISSSQAVTVLRLVLILLARHNIGNDVKVIVPSLLLLGIIAAHCAGYTEELLQLGARNVIISAYSAALIQLN